MHFIPSFYFIVFNSFTYFICDAIDNDESENLSANNIAETLISVVGANLESSRITELKEKLKKIDSYVVDKYKYTELLKNITTETDLNQTNFFNALYERDDFKFLANNETKNLYLKLKQNMNRDDIIKILAKKGNTSKLLKPTRKADIGLDYWIRDNDDDESDLMLDTIVDEIIAESPKDRHKYDSKDNKNIYWDPQGELRDLKEYHQHDGRRIFKGERTNINYYPFMVSVHVMGRFWCGGSLYSHDLVLTSAACLQLMHNNRFYRENPKVLQVRVGSNHSRIGGEMVDALEVYFHPSYNPRTLRNNIAVIRTRYHLFFTYRHTPKIISISRSPGSLPNTAEVLLLGWGVRKISQKMSYQPVFLQRKFLPVYPNVFCKEVYGDKFITSTMFCAGTITTGEGACDHDAGGPAILAGKLVGIISFGPTLCGFPNAPTVFTLVGAYADWIETINKSMPSYHVAHKRTTTLSPVSELHDVDLYAFFRPKSKFSDTSAAGTLTTPTISPDALRKKKLKLFGHTFGYKNSLH